MLQKSNMERTKEKYRILSVDVFLKGLVILSINPSLRNAASVNDLRGD